MKILGLLCFIFSFAAEATPSLRAPEVNVSGQARGKELELAVKPPSGYHINLEAPISCAQIFRVAPANSKSNCSKLKATDTEVRFRTQILPESGYQIGVYLCDNAKTVCEKHTVTLEWDADEKTVRIVSGAKAFRKESSSGGDPLRKSSQNSLFLSEPEGAMSEALRTGKPLLIDFSAIWCPPCNELNEDVFSSTEFKDAVQDFVALQVDPDSEKSWNLSSRYKITGFPTVIFANSQGEEIGRVTGYRSRSSFIQEMKNAWNLRESSIASWNQRAKQGDREALDFLGNYYLANGKYQQALEFLEKSSRYREKYHDALIGNQESFLKRLQPKKELIALLESSLQEFPNSPGSIERRSKLASIYREEKNTDAEKKTQYELLSVAHQLRQMPDSFLEQYDLSRAELWSSIAGTFEELGDSDRAKRAWKSALLEYDKKIKTGFERGYHLEKAHCLWKTGEIKQAESIYEKFEKKYPEEFTFYYNHASMKLNLKAYREAEEIGSKALKYSYGDNRLKTTILLVKALRGQGDKLRAQQMIRGALASATLPEDPHMRTHRFIRQLKELGRLN